MGSLAVPHPCLQAYLIPPPSQLLRGVWLLALGILEQERRGIPVELCEATEPRQIPAHLFGRDADLTSRPGLCLSEQYHSVVVAIREPCCSEFMNPGAGAYGDANEVDPIPPRGIFLLASYPLEEFGRLFVGPVAITRY